MILTSLRWPTLLHAAQILVLDKGRAADLGTHGELAARPGIYKEICDIQMSRDDRALIEEGGDA